jgi:hypothetical protein
MLRASMLLAKAPPVPPARRFRQYYHRHKELILLSKREISPLLIQQGRVRRQQEQYALAISKLLAPLSFKGPSTSKSPNPTEIAASVALISQAHKTASGTRDRIRRSLHHARRGQAEFRSKYHTLYAAAQSTPASEVRLQALLADRKAALVPLAKLIEMGKQRR